MQVYLILAFIFVSMIIVEQFYPAREFDKPPYWWTRAIFFNSIQLVLTVLSGYIWHRFMHDVVLFDGASYLGTSGTVVAGYLIITFVFYWWHRWRHESDFLWLYLHQIHHSPRRIEVATSFYKHPVEIFLDSMLTSLILYTILGASTEAATITVAIAGIAEMIYHWNIKTPYWMGYFFQRPEMHLVHHKQGWHQNNYSDLPLWDMLFGTYENPREFDSKCGYKDNREVRVLDMLRFINVNPRLNVKQKNAES